MDIFDSHSYATPPVAPAFIPLIQEVGSTVSMGIPYGLPVSVPYGYAAVVSRDLQVLYVLGPGEYQFHPQQFPLLAQTKRGQAETGTMRGAIHLVRTSDITDLPWECGVSLSSEKRDGLTYCQIRGRFWGRVVDPGRFVASLLQMLAAAQKGSQAIAYAQANLSQGALTLLGGALAGAVAAGIQRAGIVPMLWRQSYEQTQTVAGQAAAAQSTQIGVELLAFQIDDMGEPLRMPCVGCGSTTAPTTYATFRRNISLFYVRFGSEQSGNYCAACAAKRALTDNGIMLVCGWWGIIGFVLTPIYFCTNLYQWGKVTVTPKQSTEQSRGRLTA